jgi:hypothetical protein
MRTRVEGQPGIYNDSNQGSIFYITAPSCFQYVIEMGRLYPAIRVFQKTAHMLC